MYSGSQVIEEYEGGILALRGDHGVLMDEMDCRQTESIRRALDAYDRGQLDLRGLISNLEMILAALAHLPGGWRDAFRHQWGILEQVYSVAVVRGQPVGSAENATLVAPALRKMRAMVDELHRS